MFIDREVRMPTLARPPPDHPWSLVHYFTTVCIPTACLYFFILSGDSPLLKVVIPFHITLRKISRILVTLFIDNV